MPSLQMVRNVLGLNALAPSDRGTGKESSGVDLVLYVFLVALIALAAWAVAAGANRAWDSFASGEFAEQWNGWLSAPAVAALAILYTIGALGTAALIMLAAALLGGLFGFLFGTPRLESSRSQTSLTTPSVPSSASSDSPAGSGQAETTGTGQQTMVQQRASARGGFQMSPALTEIADWLTKIIVGLGLVQAGPIMSGFASIVRFLLQDARLDYFFAAGAVVPAVIVVGLIGGFMVGYLLMALFIGRELAYAAVDMEALQTSAFQAGERSGTTTAQNQQSRYFDAVSVLRGADNDTLSLGAWAQGTAGMPHEVVSAAETVAARDLGGINTPEELQAWAKAQTLLGHHAEAVRGLRQLVTMRKTADNLYDLGRALQWTGDVAGAERAFAEARGLTGAPDATTRAQTRLAQDPQAISRLLYANPPQPDRLLELLEATIAAQPSGESDATVQMWLACALGQKFRELQLANAPLPERTAISDRAYAAVKKSLDAGMTLSWLQLLTNRNDPGKAGQPQTEREDDLEPFYAEQRFRELLKL